MRIQLLLVLAAVAVYCESPPRLIKPVPNPSIAVQPTFYPPIEMDPSAAELLSYMSVTPAVNKYLKEQNPKAQLAYVPFKILKYIAEFGYKILETVEIEMAESTCKIDDFYAALPDKCTLSGKGAHYKFRAVVGRRYNPEVGHDQIAVLSLTNLEDKDE